MPFRIATTLILALALASIPALAQAERRPTKRERVGVAHAAQVPKRCLRIRVSTVNDRYASAYRRNRKRSCRRYQADGVAVFKQRRHHRSRWRFVTAGSAFDCPVPHTPKKVARDLHIRCFED